MTPPPRRRRLPPRLLAGLVAGGGLLVTAVLVLQLAAGRSGSAAGPTGARPSPSASPASPAATTTATKSGSAATPVATAQASGGWSRTVVLDGWRLILPDDAELRPSAFGSMRMWLAGDGDRLRGVVAGPIDAPAGATLDEIAARVRGELGMIPGGGAVSAGTRVTLPVGDAITMTRTVGATGFRAWALRLGTRAFRLMVAGYDDATADAVAASLAAAP